MYSQYRRLAYIFIMIFLYFHQHRLSGGVEQFETLSRYTGESFLSNVGNTRVDQSWYD